MSSIFNKRVATNLSLSFLANFVALFVSFVTTAMLPRFMEIEEYGVWQLYLFYLSFVGAFHLGWTDGIGLRYVGKDFYNLNAGLLKLQIYGICLLATVIACVSYLTVGHWNGVNSDQRVLGFVLFAVPFMHLSWVTSFILQITNNSAKSAKVTILERGIFIILSCFLLAIGLGAEAVIVGNLFALVISAVTLSIICRRMFIARSSPLKEVFFDSIENIRCGWKLLVANLSGLLIVGILRYSVALAWDISTFGKLSLGLSLCGFFMTFVNSCSIVFFPVMKVLSIRRLRKFNENLGYLVGIVLVVLFLTYFPLHIVFYYWLPKYREVLSFFSLLFPMFYFETKNVFLFTTILKTQRKEGLILCINLFAVAVSVIAAVISTVIFKDLKLVALSIFFVFSLKFWISNVVVNSVLGTKNFIPDLINYVFILIFVFATQFLRFEEAFSCVVLMIAVYSVSNIQHVKKSWQSLKKLNDLP